MGIPWDGTGWDGMGRHNLLWDGTEKYVPWTSLRITTLRKNKVQEKYHEKQRQ